MGSYPLIFSVDKSINIWYNSGNRVGVSKCYHKIVSNQGLRQNFM